jgi:hypothetical protein
MQGLCRVGEPKFVCLVWQQDRGSTIQGGEAHLKRSFGDDFAGAQRTDDKYDCSVENMSLSLHGVLSLPECHQLRRWFS